MKTIIAGSRRFPSFGIRDYPDWLDPVKKAKVVAILEELIRSHAGEITSVICGEAWGIDTLGKEWAVSNNIGLVSMPANWKVLGSSAGPVRNTEMSLVADSLICLHSGSSGSLDMVRKMKRLGKPVFVQKI